MAENRNTSRRGFLSATGKTVIGGALGWPVLKAFLQSGHEQHPHTQAQMQHQQPQPHYQQPPHKPIPFDIVTQQQHQREQHPQPITPAGQLGVDMAEGAIGGLAIARTIKKVFSKPRDPAPSQREVNDARLQKNRYGVEGYPKDHPNHRG